MKKIKKKIKDVIKKIADWIDPYHQSFLFFPWKFWSILIVGFLCVWMTKQVEYVQGYPTGFLLLINNPVTDFVVLFVHEMLGHNLVGEILCSLFYYSYPSLGVWLLIFAGDGVSILLPLSLYVGMLRIQGGRWLMPLFLYWLSFAFLNAGIYASDARACSFRLGASDMMTVYRAGSGVCGDYHHLLKPLGLLPYDQWVAGLLVGLGMFCFIMAVWSLYRYIYHAEEDYKNTPKTQF